MTHEEAGKAIIEALSLSPYAGKKLLEALDARYRRTKPEPIKEFDSQGLLGDPQVKCPCGAPATRYTAGMESDGPIAVCAMWGTCLPERAAALRRPT